MSRLYLDHAATTPLCREAYDAMQPWLLESYGNPSSIHEDGRKARMAIDEAREVVASALGCDFSEVVFTSGGTEAANLAILGAALNYRGYERPRVLMSAVEHHCVLHCRKPLEELGYVVETIPVDRVARVDLGWLESAMGDDVLLVAVMHANNELGTIQPADEVARLAEEHGALYFCDAVQTFGAEGRGEGVSPMRPEADASLYLRPFVRPPLLSVSSHKIHGPKGVGALVVRAGVRLRSLIHGGGQERELRPGTENVAGIVGFGAAAKAWVAGAADGDARKRAARDLFLDRLADLVPQRLRLTVPDREAVLPGHAHVRFEGVGAESMLMVLDMMGLSASSGSACSAGSLDASHVLLACGYSEAEAKEGLRFTFGSDSTSEEAEAAAQTVARAVRQVTRASTL